MWLQGWVGGASDAVPFDARVAVLLPRALV